MSNSKIDFWNDRSKLEGNAGTDDFILKDLELDVLLSNVPEKSHVLDVGCGNGKTLRLLSSEKNCTGLGLDFSDGMIEVAELGARQENLLDCLRFQQASIQEIPDDIGSFDVVLSERSLINLDSLEDQYLAFCSIMSHLKSGGKYLMVESSADGLARINAVREKLGLELIDSPWHNTFVSEDVVRSWESEQYQLVEEVPFSSTYYLMSRAVYAKLSKDAGEDLRYDSDINLLSTQLPALGDFGPTRLWIWVKK